MPRGGEFKPLEEMVRNRGGKRYEFFCVEASNGAALGLVREIKKSGRDAFREDRVVFAEVSHGAA